MAGASATAAAALVGSGEPAMAAVRSRYERAQPIGLIAVAAPNAEQTVLKVTPVSQTAAGAGAVVGAGNAAVTLQLNPSISAGQIKTFARNDGTQFWLVIQVEASKNPGSLFGVTVKAKRSAGSTVMVDAPVQTFNLFSAGSHQRHGMGYATDWQVDISGLVRSSRVDLAKPLEVTVKPVAGNSSGIVRVKAMRIEAQ